MNASWSATLFPCALGLSKGNGDNTMHNFRVDTAGGCALHMEHWVSGMLR